jgi:outer membrane biosynthesis protein TonB
MNAPTDNNSRKRQPLLLFGAIFTATVMLAGGAALLMLGDNTPPPRRVPEPIIVRLVPPPPPPPPPPEQKEPEPEVIEQPKMVEPETKDEPIEEPKEEAENEANDEPPPGPLALDAEAEGPGDAMGLGANPGGRGLLGGGGRSRWGWYASMVQGEIESALRNNAKTRNSLMQVQLRLWADSSGRINRVQIVSSNGTAELNAVLQNVVLSGLRLREGPPGDMPMPMVTRITVRRPS